MKNTKKIVDEIITEMDRLYFYGSSTTPSSLRASINRHSKRHGVSKKEILLELKTLCVFSSKTSRLEFDDQKNKIIIY